jgi:acetoin:2,6-dichlorophenolindophenol oxidoreductase subunit alpha
VKIIMEDLEKISLLRKMIKIRSFEEKVAEYKMDNKIEGPVHTRIGEEAIDAGVCSALSPQDHFLGTWRSHGHMIARGANINYLMAEIFGKKTGFNGGKGGSMHVCDSSIGSLGASAIVGSGFGVACGAAFASLYKNDGKVSCIFFGDGASNEGTFSECMNLASTWKLPLLFLLENNGFAITTPLTQSSVSQDLFHRAEPFGISSKQIDGQNVEEIYNNVKLAITHIKEGNGPVLLEAKTFRFQEHQEGAYYAKLADVGYRDKHLVEYWKENKDPIKLYSKQLLAEKVITTEELDRISKEEKHNVDNAIRYAETSPFPSIEEAYSNVFI